jgi:hypothetical protein
MVTNRLNFGWYRFGLMKDLCFFVFKSTYELCSKVGELGMISYPRWICLVPFGPRTSKERQNRVKLWCQPGHSPVNFLDSFTQSYSLLYWKRRKKPMDGLKRHGTQDGAAWCHLGQLVNSKWDGTIVATTQPFSTWFAWSFCSVL